ncbi:aldose epimerase family protein [Nonomuraea gerenzanensis]|uniref:Aldose 1-epimerase n=1 Tax=Nonomuraea gerenzanensis TaxID=93944 RepID=A0A1M4E3I2_9ACTN|nr:aldose epimerase family protein [Nonomuraea gerenzanensis]UBU15616.1 galactose mutarotase [Nonomuraea gerenzanensis]SBO93383.1 Aldose 1-epimerase [Nonomuraea gerenzanensis]
MIFGTLPSGQQVECVELSSGRLRAEVLTYGAIIRTLEVSGVNVVLGLDTLDDYRTRSRYFGAVVGRYGNRIAGARFTLDGVEFTLPANNGPNCLHGGIEGFDSKVWTIAERTGSSVTLTLTSPDGDQGFPGTLTASVTYTLADDGLRIDYAAESDAATVVNLTNHSYFNLKGGGDVLDHVVQMAAEHYLPVDDDKIPTGEPAPVKGTPFDFTEPHPVGERYDGAYDHCFVLDGSAIRVTAGGLTMEVTTTEPGVQFYAGGMLDGGATPYGPFAGLCLETQHYPDAPNQPQFPSTVLRPGERRTSTTTYRFI